MQYVHKRNQMKKIIFTLLVGLIFLPSLAIADVCVIVQRTVNNILPPNEVNVLNNACDREIPDTCTAIDSYNLRIKVGDILNIYDASRCQPDPGTGAQRLVLIVQGLSLENAREYKKSSYEFTGEYDPETGDALIRETNRRKYKAKFPQMPDENYIVVQCDDLAQYLENKVEGELNLLCD